MPRRRDEFSPPDFVMQAYAAELTSDELLAVQLLFSLRGAVQRVNSDLVGWLGSDALSPGRFQALMILRARKGPVLQRDLVRQLGISRASVSELVEVLQRDGLVVTRPDSTHGRRIYVELTADGYRLADRQIRENARRLDTLLGLPAPEKRDLITNLDALARPVDPDAD